MMNEIDKSKTMHAVGYIIMNPQFLSMNNSEYKAYQSWLNDCTYSIHGKRFYGEDTDKVNTSSYKMRKAFSETYKDWFLLKCIAKRIREKDKENGTVDNTEFVSWMNTTAKGNHVVLTSKGRVFHVMANKSLFNGNKFSKKRDVYELKKTDLWQVRVCDGNKECMKSVRTIRVGKNKVKNHDVYITTENVRKHLKNTFTAEILRKSLNRRDYEHVMAYGNTRESHLMAHAVKITLGNRKTNEVEYYNGYKELANTKGIGYSALRAKFMRMKGKELVLNGESYVVIEVRKPAKAKVVVKKKHNVAKELTERVFMKNLRKSKNMRKSMAIIDEKRKWKLMYDDYRSLYEASLAMGMPVKESVVREVLSGWVGNSPRFEEWVKCAMDNINKMIRITKMRKYWGKRRWEERKNEFKKDKKKFNEWCRKKGIPVYNRSELTLNDVFGTDFEQSLMGL